MLAHLDRVALCVSPHQILRCCLLLMQASEWNSKAPCAWPGKNAQRAVYALRCVQSRRKRRSPQERWELKLLGSSALNLFNVHAGSTSHM